MDATERAVTSEPLNLDLNAAPAKRALGIQWSLEHDTFSFDVNLQTKPSTRRGILSVIASLYDPVGFVAPFILTGKCILQELCRRGIGWDDPLPEDLSPRWEKWKSGLQRLKEVSILRCYQPQGFCKTVTRELHHFSDASNIGYGLCSYLRSKNEDGEVHCSLVMAKARVAPTKLTSIPRLELSAAVITARSSVMLKNELEMIHGEMHREVSMQQTSPQRTGYQDPSSCGKKKYIQSLTSLQSCSSVILRSSQRRRLQPKLNLPDQTFLPV